MVMITPLDGLRGSAKAFSAGKMPPLIANLLRSRCSIDFLTARLGIDYA